MLECKGPCRNWFLNLVSTRFFNEKNKNFNFHNPAWLVIHKQNEDDDDPLYQQSDNVLDFMDKTGGIVQEIYGLNYNDLMNLDRHTYNRIKKAVFKICERRTKEQEEHERQEAERLKKAEAEQAKAAARR